MPAPILNVFSIAQDGAGRFRHPARPHRIRTGVEVAQVPLFGKRIKAAVVLADDPGGDITGRLV